MNAHPRQTAARWAIASAIGLALAWPVTAVQAQSTPVAAAAAATQAVAPDAFIKRITDEVFATVKADKGIQQGDLRRVQAMVESKILPNVNLQRMTSAAVGRPWRQATPEQKHFFFYDL